MAFEWLTAANVGQAGQALGALGGIASLFQKQRDPYQEIPSLIPMLQAAMASKTYAEAAVNPDSPYFKNLAALNEETIRRDSVANILKQITLQNRARARGQVAGAVTGERQDEARAGTLAELFAGARDRSRLGASQQLAQGAQANAQAAGAFGGSVTPFALYGAYDAKRQQAQYEAPGKFMTSLADLFKSAPGSTPQQQDQVRGTAGVPWDDMWYGRQF